MTQASKKPITLTRKNLEQILRVGIRIRHQSSYELVALQDEWGWRVRFEPGEVKHNLDMIFGEEK